MKRKRIEYIKISPVFQYIQRNHRNRDLIQEEQIFKNQYVYKVKDFLTIMEKEKCQVCSRYTPTVRRCILCGKNVCPRCFRISMGVCKACVPGQEKEQYDVLTKYID
jgi:hypothetical protein